MGRLQRFIDSRKEEIKFSSTNPRTFEEKWGFVTTRARLISLLSIFLLLFGLLFTFFILYGPLSFLFIQNNRTIERVELEKQQQKIESLTEKLATQDLFIANLQDVILGKIKPADVTKKQKLNPINSKKLDSRTSLNEQELTKKVKEDLRTSAKNGEETRIIQLFQVPVKGIISQNYNRDTHPALDIVAKADDVVQACLAGVILYAGYSRNDGHFIVIDHGDEYLSIYKHNKVNLKKSGQRVQAGDPIAVIGNTGENSSGPHLHFELWHQQKPVNPTQFIKF